MPDPAGRLTFRLNSADKHQMKRTLFQQMILAVLGLAVFGEVALGQETA
jgi:hypothetical protein